MYCHNCGEELLPDAKYCQNCGTKIENNVQMTAPVTSGEAAQSDEPRKKMRLIGAAVFVVLLVLVGMIAVFFPDAVKPKTAASPTYSVSSVARQTPVPTPMTWGFADDTEELAQMMKDSFSDSASVTWYVNGMKFFATIRMKTISSDDLSAAYASDPAAQVGIDKIAASQKEANQAVCDKLKSNGHSGFTVVFTMKTSDGFEMVTTENGEITYCISADNFRYG